MVSNDIQEAAGPLQACAGHQAGCEAVVHAMNEIMSPEETEAIFLVDATNALNTSNRLALWKEGEVDVLLREGRMIQKRLVKSRKAGPSNKAKILQNLLWKVKSTWHCAIKALIVGAWYL